MTTARNDRNTVKFGPSRSVDSYRLDRLEENLQGEIAVTEQTVTNYVNEQITNITGNAELLVGTVVTYTTATNSGTVDIDGSIVPFANATSVRLEVDDVVILSANENYPDPFAVGLYQRNGGPVGYDTYAFIVPSAVPGLPRTVVPFGPSPSSSFVGGPLIVEGDSAYAVSGIPETLVNENWNTPLRTNISLPVPPFGTVLGSAQETVCVNGTVTAVSISDTNNTASLAVDSGTGWVLHDYALGNVARYPDNDIIYGAFGRKKIAGVWTSGTWLVEIDDTGAVTDTDLTVNMGNMNTYGWCAAGGGHVVVAQQGSSSGSTGKVYVDGTVFTHTFGVVGGLPWFNAGAKEGAATSCVYGDSLYYLYRSNGTIPTVFDPAGAPLGLGIMDLAGGTLTTVTYDDIITATGNREDGEPIYPSSIEVVNGTHAAIGGGISYSYFDPVNFASHKETRRPCVWLYDLAANTVTSYVTADTRITNYSGWKGTPAADGTYVDYGQTMVGCAPGSTKLVMAAHVRYIVRSGGVNSFSSYDVWLEGLDVV